jgi:hypothetical protein
MNYRLSRRQGVTTLKTVDVIIATFCIRNGHVLLHADRDFEPIREHLGLPRLERLITGPGALGNQLASRWPRPAPEPPQ